MGSVSSTESFKKEISDRLQGWAGEKVVFGVCWCMRGWKECQRSLRAQNSGTQVGWRSSFCPFRRGPGRKRVSHDGNKFFNSYGICSWKAGLANPFYPPPPSKERGRGAEKHLAQMQESWKRLAELTGIFFHSAPNVLQSSWSHIDSGFCPVICLKL